MIDVKETSLKSMLDRAINEAKNNQSSPLLSMTKKIHDINPLRFFEAAEQLAMNRSFWSATAETFYIVGAGSACDLADGAKTIEQMEENWQNLLAEAIIHNPYKTSGTGLLTLGGMSFDRAEHKSERWKNFSHLSFIIPEFILTKNDDSCYLTINIRVREDDHPGQLAERMKRMERTLLDSSVSLPRALSIKSTEDVAPSEWKQTVKCAADYIKQHHADKIVLARELQVKLSDEAHITPILRGLIETQTNSYVFAFERGEDCFLGASPERLVKQDKDKVLSTCLAGTAPRGKTQKEDARIANSLLHDEKNRSEHDFVVKMIRQSMDHYCFNVDVPEKPVIYPLKNLQHLYTPVTATLRKWHSIFDIIGKLHPTPALGGVPREKSLAFIRNHERLDRGWYGAPVGWLDSNFNGEFAVGIRSGLVQGDQVSLFAGCGIVRDSDPEEEYDETNIKFMPMLSVLGG
ncbi:isochorismate synthase MenF [Lentibacillus kapialis]|uniref:Isochorismate synthase MenF n=1 Tax=Lentibacillus kapialis TaxID=340214 RepID=A0A917UZ92_9BACI|nr:isochorismate synthase [Lentibacillus kapialis]GGJ99689.1 isochorismate synthase MenF [Lentibacillus kapialis]